MSEHATFFRIYPPTDKKTGAKEWAHRYWDTYGFDYDKQQTTDDVVIAWSLDSDDELKEALSNAEIEYTTFKADPDSFFI